MEIFAAPAREAFWMIGAMGLVFRLLGLATKRSGILAAMFRVRGEFATNLGLALVNLILLAPLFVIPAKSLHDTVGTHPSLVALWPHVPELLLLVLVILIYDLMVY